MTSRTKRTRPAVKRDAVSIPLWCVFRVERRSRSGRIADTTRQFCCDPALFRPIDGTICCMTIRRNAGNALSVTIAAKGQRGHLYGGASIGTAFCKVIPQGHPPNAGGHDTRTRPLDPVSGGCRSEALARLGLIDRSIGGVTSRLDAICTLVTIDPRTVTSRLIKSGDRSVPPMEMKGNGTVLEQPTTPSASEEQPCPVSTSRQFAGRSRSSRRWTGSASSPRNDRGCNGREAVRCTRPVRAIAARSR